MTRQIQLWLDSTSDPDSTAYCVSLCETGGEEIKCLDTYAVADHADAWAAAKDQAQRRDLPAVEIDDRGQETRRVEFTASRAQ